MRRLALFLACLILPFCVAQIAQAKIQYFTTMGRDGVYWAPPDTGGKQPLLLFSHGYDSCSTQSTFLTEALAADGYWVFGVDHDDAGCGKDHPPPPVAFDNPDGWDSTTYAARRYDIHNLLGFLRRDPRFKDKIDFTRVGLIGHSLGGYTMLGLAGAWPDWSFPLPIKAVLALSPYAKPFTAKHTMGGLKAPVMFQGGTKDINTPQIEERDGAYDQAPAPKYYVEFSGAEHLTWTDIEDNPYYKDPIIAYSKAFLDHYVKGEPATPNLTEQKDVVAQIRYNSELGKK